MGKKWRQWQILFSWAPKSLQAVTAALKLKDACFLEGSYDKSGQHIKNQSKDIILPIKVHLVKAVVFLVVMHRYESWTIKKAEYWRNDAFELWCCVRKHLTVGFLCAVSYLSWALCSLSVPVKGKRSRQTSPRTEMKEMGCLPRISFIIFSIWWKGLFRTLFSYGSPLGLMASIAPCFLGKLVKFGLLIFI